MKKILFIKSQKHAQWEGMWIKALKQIGYSVEEAWVFEHFNYIIKRIGTLASWFGTSKSGLRLLELYKTFSNKSIIKKLENKFDIIIMYNGWMEFTEHTWQLFDEQSEKIIALLGDNPFITTDIRFNLNNYLIKVDLFLTADRYAKFLFDFYDERKSVLIPAGTDNELFYPIEPNTDQFEYYGSDLLFVGTGYGTSPFGINRAATLNELADFDLKIYGTSGWKHLYKYFPKLKDRVIDKNLSVEELNIAQNCAKIILGLTNPIAVDGSHTRIFDSIASGAFVISEHREYLKELFPGQLLITFKSHQDLSNKVKYFLEHENERKEIAEKTRNHLIANFLVTDVVKILRAKNAF